VKVPRLGLHPRVVRVPRVVDVALVHLRERRSKVRKAIHRILPQRVNIHGLYGYESYDSGKPIVELGRHLGIIA
jgi:hypothetical protein